ncbi:hypothetical protein EV193_11389 [Herbihabitans rhizosphaerae]|uniref:Uncharacterized protein n=1 Tax=Herbihabitans rhizosphaerae TaxID=1872711 RepID=A0A4Q7KDG5_9PSEU|nr:hypothetical protein [Herbihabitans rhizosphaerae]RZS32245.1 hypothetical protein EV193_11389 [Herbihabitans rhizosphaerae]
MKNLTIIGNHGYLVSEGTALSTVGIVSKPSARIERERFLTVDTVMPVFADGDVQSRNVRFLNGAKSLT